MGEQSDRGLPPNTNNEPARDAEERRELAEELRISSLRDDASARAPRFRSRSRLLGDCRPQLLRCHAQHPSHRPARQPREICIERLEERCGIAPGVERDPQCVDVSANGYRRPLPIEPAGIPVKRVAGGLQGFPIHFTRS